MAETQNKRELFGELLLTISKNVYFQVPEGFKMNYPAIKYSISRPKTQFADNVFYTDHMEYTVTVIDRDPDSALVERVKHLPYCKYDNNYVSQNLYHTVFTIIF